MTRYKKLSKKGETFICKHCNKRFVEEHNYYITPKYCSPRCHYADNLKNPPFETRQNVRIDKVPQELEEKILQLHKEKLHGNYRGRNSIANELGVSINTVRNILHPENVKYYQKWYEDHKEQASQNQEKYLSDPTKWAKHLQTKNAWRARNQGIEYQQLKANPDAYLKMLIRSMVGKSLAKYSAVGKIYPIKKYGIDVDAIIKKVGLPPEDGVVYHLDHKIPLSWFNFNDPEEIKKAFAPENLQWLPASENLSKGNKTAYSAIRRVKI